MDSPAIVIARFLRANNYNDTLGAFLHEAKLPPDAGQSSQGEVTLEEILNEKSIFDLSLKVEKVSVGDKEKKWSLPAPSVPTHLSSLPSAANILHVSIHQFENEVAHLPLQQLLFATTADHQLHVFAIDENFSLLKSMGHLHNSPILSCIPVGGDYLRTITSGMSGQTLLYDHADDQILDQRRDHQKYVVNTTTCKVGSTTLVATAGWDAKIFLYQIIGAGNVKLGEPVASITTLTNPESIEFVKHPDLDRPILLITRRDSTSLYYYRLPAIGESSAQSPPIPKLTLLGSQNLAPHSNSWITFSPSSIALCPKDPTRLAVATSAVPHMKLIIVRLLIPSLAPPSSVTTNPTTQAAQNRANLAIQDREEAAIMVHVSTLAPQTPYSTPQVVWRPDGSGVWVNGDDGLLRGLEVETGKIVATLKGGHEPGSKIRSIWCGPVNVKGTQEEWVVSGGFDRKLVVWKPPKET